jgi:tetratricopeptide (TPR) repeat protein
MSIVLCGHCGIAPIGVPKRCAKCMQVVYCAASCQVADWGTHKKTCKPCSSYVIKKILAADAASDWRQVQKFAGYDFGNMPDDAAKLYVLTTVVEAYETEWRENGVDLLLDAAIPLQKMLIKTFEMIQHFRDQGDSICKLADFYGNIGDTDGGIVLYKEARKIAEAHGFFSVECRSCIGLGRSAMNQGRKSEAADFLRNAVAAGPLVEANPFPSELNALYNLIDVLFDINAIDEVEPLVERFTIMAKKSSMRDPNPLERFTPVAMEVHSFVNTARLHEKRGRSQEADKEIRAMLSFMRKNKTLIQHNKGMYLRAVHMAQDTLEILDTETPLSKLWLDVMRECFQ